MPDYNLYVVRHVDAIFSQGTFRPLEPLTLPEGTPVRLRVEELPSAGKAPAIAKVHTPKLAHPEDAPDFAMDVREAGDAGI